MTAPTISVIIPARNGGGVFKRCLAAVAASTVQPAEFFVVDDGSIDDTPELARLAGAQVLGTNAPGSGPAVARNLAASLATGDVLFFFDSDVEIQLDTIERVQRAFADDPALTALFGSYDDSPGHPGFLSQYKNLFHHYVHQHGSENASTFWSGCGAVRREAFLEHGGFSSRYELPSIEDIELGYALRRSGHRIKLDKALQVKHLKQWTLFSLLHSDIVARGIPWTRLVLREGAFLDDLNLQTRNRISVVMVYLGLLGLLWGFGQPLAWLPALAVFVTLFWLNRPLYQFMAARRGWRFGLASVAPHWLYYAYNGVSFGVGTLLHLIEREPKPGRRIIVGRHKRTFALVMGCILVMAALLRFHDLASPAYSPDEAYQLEYARHSWPVIFARTFDAEEMPLSFAFVHILLRFGEQSFWLRTVSAFESLLTVALLYRFVGRIWGRGGGAVAASLLAVSAFQVSVARTVTPYALFGLLALLSFHSLFRALKTGRYDSWIAYAVNTSFCLLAHSSAVFILCSQILVAATYLWLRPAIPGVQSRLAGFGLSLGAIVAVFVAVLSAAGLLTQALIWGGRLVDVTPFIDSEGVFGPTSWFNWLLSSDGFLSTMSKWDGSELFLIALAMVGVGWASQRNRRFCWMMVWVVISTLLVLPYRAVRQMSIPLGEIGAAYIAFIVFVAIGLLAMGTGLEKGLPRWKWATWGVVIVAPLLVSVRQVALYYDSFK